MSATATNRTWGIGFVELLTLLFIGLKLTGYIDWSWLWVLSPLWIGFGLVFLLALIVAVTDTPKRRY